MTYRHTQTASWILIPLCLGFAGLPALFLIEDREARWVLLPVLLVLAVTFLVFRCLTVTVDDQAVRVAFGWGWPCRSVALTEVTEARRVRNSVWHGWGIHWSLDGWVWNISGFDAVELRLTRGRRWRIGTDEPAELERVIRRALPTASPSRTARGAHQPS